MRHGKRFNLAALACPPRKLESALPVVVDSIWIAFVILLGLSLQGSIAQSQENRKTVEDALIASLNSEKDHGTYTFYRQAYTDADNRKAVYTGSIYASITAFRVLDCVVNLEVAVIDHFSGTVNNRPTGEQQDSTTYSVTFPVNREIAENLTLRDARPAELSVPTHATCTERPSCTFTWLEIRGSRGEIEETQIVNGALDFKGSAQHFLVPLSSVASGDRLAQAFRTLAQEKCR